MSMQTSSQKPLFGIFLAVFSYLFFAISGAFVSFTSNHLSTWQILFLQNLICTFCVIPFFCNKNFKKALHIKPHWHLHLFRGLSGLGSYLLFYLALKYMDLVDATVLSYTTPFFLPFFWRVWTKEKVPKGVWWAILLGFLGICCILRPGSSLLAAESFLGLLAGAASALSLMSISFLNQKEENPLKTLLYFFLSGAFLTLPFATMFWIPLDMNSLIILLAVGIANSLGQILLVSSYRHAEVNILSPLCYSIVIFTMGINWQFFNSPPTFFSYAGCLLIITGGVMTNFFTRKKTVVAENHYKESAQANAPSDPDKSGKIL